MHYTYEQIEDCPFPFFLSLTFYWIQEPPIHDLVRWYLEYKPKKQRNRRSSRPSPERLNGAEVSDAEAKFLHSMPVKTFDCLPVHVQDWLKKNTKAKNGR